MQYMESIGVHADDEKMASSGSTKSIPSADRNSAPVMTSGILIAQ